MDRAYFDRLTDRFRSLHLWMYEDGKRQLRHKVIKDRPILRRVEDRRCGFEGQHPWHAVPSRKEWHGRPTAAQQFPEHVGVLRGDRRLNIAGARCRRDLAHRSVPHFVEPVGDGRPALVMGDNDRGVAPPQFGDVAYDFGLGRTLSKPQ